jgi:L-asparaginase II
MSLSVVRSVSSVLKDRELAGDVRLVEVFRGEYVNNVHRGIVVVRDTSGSDVLSLGDDEQPVFLRSAAKPFQVMPAVLSGGIERFGISDRELAVLCASHHAEPYHVEAVLSVLAKLGLDESYLHCGVHPPTDEDTAKMRWRQGIEPSPVCNNCSGAHTGMLLACRAEGWPIDRYEQPEHPLQRRTRDILATFAGLESAEVQLATDNCAVPTFRLPMSNGAQAFARLASPERLPAGLAEAAGRIVAAMTAYPQMIGGTHSWDTALMRAAKGEVVSKGGADGFQGMGRTGSGIGIAIKISDGNGRVIPAVALAVLRHLDLLDPRAISALREYEDGEIRSHCGGLVGSIKPCMRFETSA